jgi:Spy/CpxP family protein refolding chaperone
MKDGVESLGRVRAQGITLLLVTFVVGALAGVALERVRAVRQPMPDPAIGMAPPFAQEYLPRMFNELDLTREQHQQIMQILQSRRPHTDSIMNAMLPRLRAVTDSVRMEILAVLTPEQATRLDSLMLEMRPRRGKMRGGPPGRRGMGGPPPQF